MRIAVTGLGAVSGIGFCVSENIESLRTGRHGMGKPRFFQTTLDVPVSEVKATNVELAKRLNLNAERTKIARRISRQLRPGAIILLHDRLPQSAERLQMVIDAVKKAGYEVGELKDN